MIEINNFEILNNGTALAIDVQTAVGYNITSILFWSVDNFKDYTMAVDLTPKLEKINNREVLIIPVSELSVHKLEDICFIEVESNYIDTDGCDDCAKPVLGICYNLSKYYKCLMTYLLEGQSDMCATCNESNSNLNMTIAVNLLIDTIIKAIDAGFYIQAIDILNNLKSLCKSKECRNCEPIECKDCNNFKQH